MSINHWSEDFELVVGLEVHAQLLTKSKAYSSDPNEYGDEPNKNISPVTLGHPGTLPVMNARTIDHAIRLGSAVGAEIRREMNFARKNYFYPDLPKGYQITQDKTPICTGGKITIDLNDGKKKDIQITRIHMEEDAGKSSHDIDPFNSLIDLNRAGVPLLEIVSEPDIRSAEEAYLYLVEVRKLLRYLDVCDGNMEEGSMRCDANVSIRPKGSRELGTRSETKNMNSLRNVRSAIEFEAQRQAEILRAGGTVHQETRNFDAAKGVTVPLRSKELAHDYRYFPEPDLPPVLISEEKLKEIQAGMPPLPWELHSKYTEMGLSDYDATVITGDRDTALYYDQVLSHTSDFKGAANWLTGDIRSWLNEQGLDMTQVPITAERLAGLVDLVASGGLSYSAAAQKLFPLMVTDRTKSAEELAKEHDLLQSGDTDEITKVVQDIIASHPDKVAAYRAGNKGLLGMFMGEVMKTSKGKFDPRKASQVVRELLEEG